MPRNFDAAFLLSDAHAIRHRVPTLLGRWTIADVFAARDAQVAGRFDAAVRLERKMKSEPAIYSALLNRLAPHRGLPRDITADEPLEGTRENIRIEAIKTFASDASSSLPPNVIADGFERLAMHGFGVDQLTWEARPDGSRLDAFAWPWPLQSVERDPTTGQLMALTETGRVPIVHGDGRWVVYNHHAAEPETWGAIIPLAQILASRSAAIRDRTANAQSHGEDKWIGTLPQGVATSSPEGTAMLAEMQKLYEFQRVMLKPFGSEIERMEAMSQNWQIFKEIIESDNRDAKLILLGQDATMTNTGGDYVKSWGLFGVRNDIIERDISAMGTAISTGIMRVWSILNFGRWDRLKYSWLIPDADEDRRREEIAKRRKAFYEDIAAARQNQFVVDQAYVEDVAKQYGIGPAPKLRIAVPTDEAAREAQAEQEAAAALESARLPKITAAVAANRHPLRPVAGG